MFLVSAAFTPGLVVGESRRAFWRVISASIAAVAAASSRLAADSRSISSLVLRGSTITAQISSTFTRHGALGSGVAPATK